MQVDVGYSTHVRQVKFSSSRIPYPSAQESETRICTSSSLTILHLPLDHLVAYNINLYKLQCLPETSVDFVSRPCLFSAKTAFVDFILSLLFSLLFALLHYNLDLKFQETTSSHDRVCFLSVLKLLPLLILLSV